MEDLSIQGQKIEKLKAHIKTLKEKKLKIDNSHVEELHKSHRLTQKIEQLEIKSVKAQTLAQTKDNIWVEINEAMNEI